MKVPIDRQTVLFALIVTGEAAIIWLAVNVVMIPLDASQRGMPALTITLLVLGASLTPRLLQETGLWGTASTAIAAAVVLLTTLAAIKLTSFPDWAWNSSGWIEQAGQSLIVRPNEAVIPVWPVIVVSAVVWWRGHSRAEPNLDAAIDLLKYGTPLALASSMGQALVRSDGADRSPAAAVLIFFACALTAISVARPSSAETAAADGPGRWLGTVVAPVLSIVIVALILAGLATRDLFDTIVWFLTPVFLVLSFVFRVIILLVALLAMIVILPLLWLISLLPFSTERVPIEPSEVTSGGGAQGAIERAGELPDPVRYLVAGAVLFLLFAGVTKLVLRKRERQPVGSETRTSVLSTSDLLASLMAWLRRPLRSHDQPESDPLAGLRGDPRWAHTVTIRETYAELLRWSRDRGTPRASGSTPGEHARSLRRILASPAQARDLDLLTDRYDDARYGAKPATAADAAAVRRAWQSLHDPEISS